MKRYLVVLFAVIIVMVSTCETLAEPAATMNLFDATSVINEVGYSLLDMKDTSDDENTNSILYRCSQELSQAIAGIMLVSDEGALAAQDQDISTITQGSYSTDAVYLPEYDISNQYTVEIDGSVYRIWAYSYDNDETLKQRTRIEFATRPETGERMVLLSLYEEAGFMTSTTLALVNESDGSSKNLYTRSFGDVTQLPIDLKKWSEGEDYDWDISLLYPDDVE